MTIKRKKQINYILISFFIVVVLFFVNRLSQSIIRYKDFGIYIPSGNYIHGIDVSKYQKNIKWDEVEKMESAGLKIRFAFIKATEGASLVDRKFARNWGDLKLTTIKKGAYHFFRPTYDGIQQAQFFIRHVNLQKGDLPPVCDVEELDGVSPVVLRKRVLGFLNTVENHYKVIPIIYANAHFVETYLNTDEFKKFPIWVAHYDRKLAPRINRDWHFWQHSEEGSVNSISSKVDFDVFEGSMSDLEDMCVK